MDRIIIALWSILANRMKTFRANACYLSEKEQMRMERLVTRKWVPPEYALEFIKMNPNSEKAAQKVICDAVTAATILHMARYTGFMSGMVDTVIRLDRYAMCSYQLGVLFGSKMTQEELFKLQAHIFNIEKEKGSFEITEKFCYEVMNVIMPKGDRPQRYCN